MPCERHKSRLDRPAPGPVRALSRSWLLILCCVLPLVGQTHPFSRGEQLVYAAGFRLFTVGTTTMEVMTPDSLSRDTALHIVSQVKTKPLFNRLYRIDDRVDLWLDHQSLQLLAMRRNINEGKYHRRDTAFVDPQAGLVFAGTDTLTAEGPVFDPIGAIYYLRSQPLNLGDTFELSIFDGRRLRPMTITVTGPVSIKVPAGEFDCLVLSPTPLDDQPTTKVGGFLKLWLALDERRTPVRVEQRTNFGTMVLKLVEIN